MLMNEIPIKQEDGYTTVLYPYYADTASTKGSILILHGMAEHHSRYLLFTEFLTKNGYDVFLYDHRGHGTDKKLDDLGFFDAQKGAAKITRDALTILDFIRQHNRGQKLIIFSHSMGTFVARNVVQIDDKIDGLVLCGTAHPQQASVIAGRIISGAIQFVKGAKHISPFMNNMMFGSKIYTNVCTRTAYDWLTRNNTIVGQYINDPYCGFTCTVSMYHDIFLLLTNAISPSAIRKTKRSLPILIISGEADPVGGCGRDVSRFFSQLQRSGFTNVDCTLYAECRHELLNEINHRKIMSDVLLWLDQSKVKPKNEEPSATTSEEK